MDSLTCSLANLTVQTGEMLSALALAACIATVARSVSVTDIQGPAFLSPLVGQTVANVTGVVTAKVKHILRSARPPLELTVRAGHVRVLHRR